MALYLRWIDWLVYVFCGLSLLGWCSMLLFARNVNYVEGSELELTTVLGQATIGVLGSSPSVCTDGFTFVDAVELACEDGDTLMNVEVHTPIRIARLLGHA